MLYFLIGPSDVRGCFVKLARMEQVMLTPELFTLSLIRNKRQTGSDICVLPTEEDDEASDWTS